MIPVNPIAQARRFWPVVVLPLLLSCQGIGSGSFWGKDISLYCFIHNRQMHQITDFRSQHWKSQIVFETPSDFIPEVFSFSGKRGEWVLVGITPDMLSGSITEYTILYFRNNKLLSQVKQDWRAPDADPMTHGDWRAPVFWSDTDCVWAVWLYGERCPKLVCIDLRTGNFSIVTEESQVATKLQDMLKHLDLWRITNTSGARVVVPRIPETGAYSPGYSVLARLTHQLLLNTLPANFMVPLEEKADYAKLPQMYIDQISGVLWRPDGYCFIECFSLQDGKLIGTAKTHADSVYGNPNAAGPAKRGQ